MLPIIGILYGDAAGIGPELIAKLCAENAFVGRCRPLLIGDLRVFRQGMEIVGKESPISLLKVPGGKVAEGTVTLLDTGDLAPEAYRLGEVSRACGEAAYQDMKCALDLLAAGSIQGLLYAPQNKTSFAMAGHELDSMDFVCRYLGVAEYGELNVLDEACTTRVTSHVPLREIPALLTTEKVLKTIEFTHKSLNRIGRRGRIAVSGLNPHNGESGLCGTEEREIIAPAVAQAREEGLYVQGPFSPDTVFVRLFRGEFDAVVTMYHDQGQIAMKLRDFSRIVTVIGGPLFPIATPAHGTAFDIAGKGVADTGAIKSALEIVSRGATKNYGYGGKRFQ